MPEWSRHLAFALVMAAAVVGGAVVLTLFGLIPLYDSGATTGWVNVVLVAVIGG